MLVEALEQILRFGALMMRAGDTAFRVRQSMEKVGRVMGVDEISVHIGLDSITASARRGGERATLVGDVAAPGVNSQRIHALEALARSAAPGTAPRELAAQLDAIVATPPRYSPLQVGAAVGGACGAFAVLNGGVGLEVVAAAIGGGVGQSLRTLLLRRDFNQYAVTALCGLVAAGVYSVISAGASYAGFGVARHSLGLISSVLFLVPGFPLVAALLDVLQQETVAGMTRLVYAVTLLLCAALGLSVVVALVGFTVETPPPRELSEPAIFVVRTLASLAGAFGFAVLFNSSPPNILYVCLLAIVGNLLRLGLHDAHLALPPATLLGALAVGLMATLASRWTDEPRIALTVPGVIIMVPGLYGFAMVVLFNQGEILGALRAAVLAGFVVGAMAVGLAAARLVSQPEWLKE